MIRRSARSGPSPLRIYLLEIARTPLLTADKERELARRVHNGDMAARGQLAVANLRLVIAIARRYRGHGMDLEDMIGAGQVGLMAAVDRYDPDRGVRFSTYATWWIRQAISRAIGEQVRLVRIPLYGQTWSAMARAGKRTAGRIPSPKFAAALSRALENPVVPIDPDKPDAVPVPDRNPDVLDTVIEADDRATLVRAIATLDERAATIIRLHYGLDGVQPQTLKQIGLRLGLTMKWVAKIEAKALARLRWACGGGRE